MQEDDGRAKNDLTLEGMAMRSWWVMNNLRADSNPLVTVNSNMAAIF
jgi:hypothetical protein